MSALPSPSRERRLPAAEIPGLNPIARGLAERNPVISEFLPDSPDAKTVKSRIEEVLAAFRQRTTPPADPMLVPFTSGTRAAVSTGQQCGLLTGPLLTLTKALATIQAAGELASEGLPVAPLFWCASEDHDLVEVTRLWVPTASGAEDRGPAPEPLAGNRQPVGALTPSPDHFGTLLYSLNTASPEAPEFLRLASTGTFVSAFRNALAWLLAPRALSFAEASRPEDKPDLVPLASRIVSERALVREILKSRADALTGRGFELQVKSDRRALPLFAIVGSERLLLHEENGRFWLKGDREEIFYSEREVVERFQSGEWLPSFAALTRPLAASTLYPVAATVLGPAEIAYWAQMYPLFGWAGIVPPVILPRPMILPLEPSARRALTKTGLPLATALLGTRAALMEQGKSNAAAVLDRLQDFRRRTLGELDTLREEILALDPNLKKPLDATRQNVDFALGKFTEKAAESAGRADEQARGAVEKLMAAILPAGQLAERILTPLSYVEKFGRERVVTAIEEAIRWDEAGLYVVEL